MKKVDIHYRRFGFSTTRSVSVPERWEDLQPYQFAACAALHTNPSTNAGFIAAFYKLPTKVAAELAKFEVYKLTELTAFVTQPNACTSFFYLQQIPGTSLVSPANRLGNISVEHFALFDSYFYDYTATPTPENLVRFVSALYLQKGEVITEIDFEKRCNYVARNIDQTTLYAIFLNYIFVHRWLSASFKFLFETRKAEPETDELQPKQPKQPKNTRPDWVKILDNLVGDDILNYDKYKLMACTLFFKTVNNRIKNYRKNGKPTH
jgi:hypothetical protein